MGIGALVTHEGGVEPALYISTAPVIGCSVAVEPTSPPPMTYTSLRTATACASHRALRIAPALLHSMRLGSNRYASATHALRPSGVPPALSTSLPTTAVAAPAAALGRAGIVFHLFVSTSTAIPLFGLGYPGEHFRPCSAPSVKYTVRPTSAAVPRDLGSIIGGMRFHAGWLVATPHGGSSFLQ